MNILFLVLFISSMLGGNVHALPGMVLYITSGTYQGDRLMDRSAANAICVSSKPGYVSCDNTNSIFWYGSFNTVDSIENLPDSYGFSDALPWFYPISPGNFTLFSPDFLNTYLPGNNVAIPLTSLGVSPSDRFWSGVYTGGGYTCSGWTTNSSEAYGSFAYAQDTFRSGLYYTGCSAYHKLQCACYSSNVGPIVTRAPTGPTKKPTTRSPNTKKPTSPTPPTKNPTSRSPTTALPTLSPTSQPTTTP